MTNLDSILKSRDITLPTKVHLVKTMVFPVVMYGCESWTIKNIDCERFDGFWVWHWRRLLRVPWTAKRFNQSILKEISPEYSLEGLMLKLRLQYFGYLMRRTDSLENILMLGNTEGRRRRGQQRMMFKWHHQLDWRKSEQASGVGDGQESLVCCSPWGRKESEKTEWLNWTKLRYRYCNHVRWGLVTLGITFSYGIYSWVAGNYQYFELFPTWYPVLFSYNNYRCMFFSQELTFSI